MTNETRQEANRILTKVEALIGYKIELLVHDGKDTVAVRKVFDNPNSKWVTTDSSDWWKH